MLMTISWDTMYRHSWPFSSNSQTQPATVMSYANLAWHQGSPYYTFTFLKLYISLKQTQCNLLSYPSCNDSRCLIYSTPIPCLVHGDTRLGVNHSLEYNDSQIENSYFGINRNEQKMLIKTGHMSHCF